MLVAAEAIGKPHHAAVVDMVMPDENGLEFASRIKSHPTLSRLKIILATSLNWQGDVSAVREAGIEAVLTKPVRRDDLIDAAARAVRGTRHPGWRSSLPEDLQPKAAPGLTITRNTLNTLRANVLLAEDNPVNVEVAMEYLTSFGCRVAVVSNGLEAVAAVRSSPFDFIFMDCQMPIMDGLTATRRIRSFERDESRSHTPVIALTANAFAEDRARCIDAGMDDYLSKPYSEDQLYGMLQTWLQATPATNAVAVHNDDRNAEKLPPARAAADAPPAALDTAIADAVLDEAVLDEAVLAPMRSKRPDLLARIIKAYLAYAPAAIADLAAAGREGDRERLGRHAHSLKSSSANLGANGLSAMCRELEQTAKTADIDTCRAQTAKICATFEAVHRVLEVEMAALTPAAEKAQNAG